MYKISEKVQERTGEPGGSGSGPRGVDYPDLETLECWLEEETDFERFCREFYEANGRPFCPGELPQELVLHGGVLPTCLIHAFSDRLNIPLLTSQVGANHLENQFFLPGRDIFINKYPRYNYPDMHLNRFFELCYVYRGGYEIEFCGDSTVDRIALSVGDFLFIPPGQSFRSLLFSDSIILNIGIRQSTFRETFSDRLPAGSYLGKFFADSLVSESKGIQYLLFRTGTDSQIRRSVQELCLAFCTDDMYTPEIINGQLGVLFLLLLQNYSGHVTAAFPDTDRYIPDEILSVLHYIEEHYRHTSVKETAEKFGFSADYLNLRFKEAVDLSMGEMILKLKMQKAAELLRSTQLPVAAIAEYLNYQDPTNLTRSFKKYYGMTPAKYRKEEEQRQ